MRITKLLILFLIVAMLAVPGNSYAQAQNGSQVADPWEGFNRLMFGFNDTVDTFLLRPTAEAYRFVIPFPMRDSVRNFINNVNTPVVLINDLLQGDGDRAWNTTARFLLNTTFGIGGLFDAGTHFGYPKHTEDFGQTLGTWGVQEGPYIVLPLFGPSNARDFWGRIGDVALNPLTYVIAENDDLDGYVLGMTVLDVVDARSRNIERFDRIREDSFDYYATIRSLYTQNRQAQIANREPANGRDLDFEFEN